jgi:hypothetical protein
MVTFLASPNTAVAWNNMSAASTEWLGHTRTRVKADLSGLTEFRMQGYLNAAGASASRLRLEYSLDGSSWASLEESAGTTGDLSLATTGLTVGSFGTIAAAARTDVFLRVMGSAGNGNADPSWYSLRMQAR